MQRLIFYILVITQIVFGAIGEFDISSPSHTIGVASNQKSITIAWTTPSVGDGEKLGKYLWKFDKNTTSNLEDDNSANEVSASTNSITIPINEEGEFYFHILPVLENGDVGVDKTFGKIVVDWTPPAVSYSSQVLENGEVEITLSSPESGVTIYYTIDGSNVDTNSTKYSNPFKLYLPKTLKFRGVDSAGNWSGEIAKYVDVNYIGNIAKVKNVEYGATIATSSKNGADTIIPTLEITAPKLAYYRYRIDGGGYSEYVTSSEKIDISKLSDGNHTIYIQGRDELNNTQTAPTIFKFTIDNTPPVVTGYIDNTKIGERNIYPNNIELLLSTNESNSTIRYTLDGDTPSKNFGYIYSKPISITDSKLVKVISYDALGNIGSVAELNISIDRVPPTTPKIFDSNKELDSNSSAYYQGKYIYPLPQKFHFSSSDNYTPTPRVYWEKEGKTPNIYTSSTGDILVSSSTILKYIAVDEANNSSPIGVKTIVIDEVAPKFGQPKFSEDCPIVDGVYVCVNNQLEISLSTIENETPDEVAIYYTTNGDTPNRNSLQLSKDGNITLHLSTNEKIFKYIAYDKVGNHSEIGEIRARYDINGANGANAIGVVLSIDDNSSINGSVQEIGVTIVNGGAEPIYYYKIDNGNYSHESNLSKGVDVSNLEDGWHTLSVVAFNGEFNSSVNSISFYKDTTPPTEPTIQVNWVSLDSIASISITTDDPNSTIFYSLDGATPNRNSLEYSSPFSIYKTTTIKAVAIDKVGNSSKVVTKFVQFQTSQVAEEIDENSSELNTSQETNITSETNITQETNITDETNITSETNITNIETATPEEEETGNIVDIQETESGQKLTIENSKGEIQNIDINYSKQNVEIVDREDGGREFRSDNSKIVVSPNGAVSGNIGNINLDISSNLLKNISMDNGVLNFESDTIVSNRGISSKIHVKSSPGAIVIELWKDEEKIYFPKIDFEKGTDAQVRIIRKQDNSIDIEVTFSLNGKLEF